MTGPTGNAVKYFDAAWPAYSRFVTAKIQGSEQPCTMDIHVRRFLSAPTDVDVHRTGGSTPGLSRDKALGADVHGHAQHYPEMADAGTHDEHVPCRMKERNALIQYQEDGSDCVQHTA